MEITIIVLSALTVGLVEIAKRVIPERFVPLLSLVCGVAIVAIGGPLIGIDGWRETVINGLVLGLTAMGLYSGGKTLAGK